MATLLKRLWLLGLALAAACGDGSPQKITAPSLASITVTGSDLIIVGQSETFTAVGNTGAPLSVVWWGTDAPAIVTVDPYGGPVTAIGVGTATIFVDSGGVRGTKTIRTLPNFTGTWKGLYEETGCEASGDWAALRVCSDSPYDFGIGEMTMTLTQNRDTVSGSFTLLGSRGPGAPVSGRVASDGTLTFAGTAPGPVVNVELQNVRFETPQKHEMTGTFEQLYSATGRSGTYRVFARLREMRSFD